MLRLSENYLLIRYNFFNNPIGALRFASSGNYDDNKIERQPDNYRPGSDSFAYENPWPKLNKGRLDWLFHDGWRRPLAPDQGGKMRRQWLALSFFQTNFNEHFDWLFFHQGIFIFFTLVSFWFPMIATYVRPDCEWAQREAYFEILRRQKAGLPYISKDLINPDDIIPTLPSDEELRDFDIVI